MASESPPAHTGGPARRLPEHGPVDWEGRRVLVTGLAVSGAAAAIALAERGARVLAVDARDGDAERDRAALLGVLGGRSLLGADVPGALPDVDGGPPELVVTSPGWRPTAPLLDAAASAGLPVWGEVELAWRLRGPRAAPWLTVTGTNGKTTTVTMLSAILSAAGLRAPAAGNIGTPLVEAVLDPVPADVLAVELSSFQLHSALTLAPRASACLNVAPDHLDWHGSLAAYTADKGRVYTSTEVACVYSVDDPVTEDLVRAAEVQEGCRAVGTTLGVPGLSMLGVVDDVLCDRAFVPERRTSAAELGTLADLAEGSGGTPAPHTVADALAAAALARAHGVPPAAVRDGLRAAPRGEHRLSLVARAEGVDWVDDSKATNPHAAAASLGGVPRAVWVAGGLAKGATYDDLVAARADRLRAVVLIGADRAPLRGALARRAPQVPVVEVDPAVDGPVMPAAVRAAASLARPGDTVLLAPASASMDQFTSYAERGDAFAAAVRAHLAAPGGAPGPASRPDEDR